MSANAGERNSHSHAHTISGIDRRRLVIVLIIVSAVLVLEVVGAWITGSLALLADAGHMLTDLVGIVVALIASVIAVRPATATQTFGYQRVEVFAALFNALVLLGVSVFVVIEAVSRLVNPGEVELLPVPMFVVGAIGLVANVIALLMLRPSSRESINMRGAYLEVFGDALGSIGVLVAALVIWLTGFGAADAIVSLLIAAMIVPRALTLLRDVYFVLSQATPREMDVTEIREHLLASEGVLDVHDVHVWSMTATNPVFSAHIVAEDAVFIEGRAGQLLDQLDECLNEHFEVSHSTFQLEPKSHAEHETQHHR